ncbi:MAG TPA: hypothetical protein VJ808_08690 [Gemmatimonadales bacterium]|nr:hypothetical protein [Gemmatimonadales bacterium]
MRHGSACWSLLFIVGLGFTPSTENPIVSAPVDARPGVAFFEPPKSIGTPLDDLVRIYSGPGLASRIAGRIRLDTDTSLRPATRELIRRRLAQVS